MTTKNLKLTCGHEIWWYGYAAKVPFPPPATLWCRECRSRVKST